ncbi:MAG: 2OG-Fe(II) oxygenase [Gammaproteobacteria bacterium]|nr:MAG: 2OG-Fe(II) oxygenase [Gammaproteobacteria bacterium]
MKMIPAFYFDHDHMQNLALEHGAAFKNAVPFRHVAIDNFLPEDIAHALSEEFPGPTDIPWNRGVGRNNPQTSQKLGHSQERHFPPLIRHVITQFYSATFLDFLATLTGQTGLITDPQFRGCGLHSTGRGGKLMVHADKSRHPNRSVDQIFNAIYFVNPGWQEAWGGHLELWDKDLNECKQRILPAFNRLVIFLTGTNTWHGHPQPLQCPPDRRRNSLAAYYYLLNRPKNEFYSGWKNFVEWRATTSEEKQMPLRETEPQHFRFENTPPQNIDTDTD